MLDDCKILLVEDEALVALDISLTLEDEGAAVTGPFATVETALPACGTALDAAVLDVDLCGSKSFPIADRLVAAGVPFMFHTGRADISALQERYGPSVPILVKPSRVDDIALTLRHLIPRR